VQELVENFIQHLRSERGQSENTQRTYFTLLNRFVTWARTHELSAWPQVELSHLLQFLEHERSRRVAHEPQESTRKLSGQSVYLEMAALRAFYRYAEK